ncbi:hypothetical protein DEU56DRAFT_833198 [Suillus clintonianus]|uniref:uncharacterized protein n=1 Tax=Suillus clintonianus TaxID=1904413 RepID=UPI001B8646CB|nr:uncharacterized protein DEU56DRAFT_833198 [Suillus clintonianus]KAG2121916.1 hypothetical protein DEU56DRAFT_833198 [Suillus clintonianus]
MKFNSITVIFLAAATGPAVAGPIGYAICQTGKVNQRDHCEYCCLNSLSRLQRHRCGLLRRGGVYVRRRTACCPSRNNCVQCSPWGVYGSLRRSRAWTHSLSE